MKRLKLQKLLGTPKSRIIVASVLILLIGGGVWAYEQNDSSSGNSDTANNQENNTADNQPNGASPDLNPATVQDKKNNDVHKDDLVKNQAQYSEPQGRDSGKSAVITSTSKIDSNNNGEVRGLVSGVIEDGGTCTYTFTKGSSTVVKTSSGVKNATNTICALLNVSVSSFASSGQWDVYLSYTSATSSVKSNPSSVEVEK